MRSSDSARGVLDQASFAVRFDWGPQGATVTGAGASVVIVVDVLSFSTAVEVGTSRGARIVPFRWRDARASGLAEAEGALVAVDRHEVSAEHPFSLSPPTLAGLRYGQRLVLPSPNGAEVAIAAAGTGATVLAGCLRNATAVASAARTIGPPIAVVAAGERWPDGTLRPALEDLIGAGLILARLAVAGHSPEAAAAVAVAAALDPVASLDACASGRELVALGYPEDVAVAAAIDGGGTVPVMRDGAFVAWEPTTGE